MFYMERFVREVMNYVEDAGMLASQGGPIMMLQIENEYGHHMPNYGDGGIRYLDWLTQLARNLTSDVPWIMCEQNNAPADFVVASNAHYALPTVGRSRNQPGMWTEDWLAWFQHWGEAFHNRAAEDVAYAVARWFMWRCFFTLGSLVYLIFLCVHITGVHLGECVLPTNSIQPKELYRKRYCHCCGVLLCFINTLFCIDISLR
eukprot:TRINITY_DN508_c0_g2_i2.p2 TRINITY_DN508_c0_g2~~TRINITY_DN508_c0_g2_i2.p2  ORF type:complete len:203 (+),score=21.26 TRINITY_DN508_c0_g2_i2:237-845(+)